MNIIFHFSHIFSVNLTHWTFEISYLGYFLAWNNGSQESKGSVMCFASKRYYEVGLSRCSKVSINQYST